MVITCPKLEGSAPRCNDLFQCIYSAASNVESLIRETPSLAATVRAHRPRGFAAAPTPPYAQSLSIGVPMKLRHTLLMSICAAPLLAQADMLAVSFSGRVFDVDSTSLSATTLATSGPSFNSLAYGAGQYWSVSFVTGQLATIDPSTGAATLGPPITGTPTGVSIRGLAWADGTLYGIQNNVAPNTTGPDSLVRIDTSSGISTLIGATGLSGIQSLAFDSAGKLFAWDATAGLVTLNRNTGLATDVNGLADGFDIQTLTFSPSGVLYGARATLYTLNPSTGAASVVGTITGADGADIRGLEFISAVPEPHTWALFGLGALVMALRTTMRSSGRR